MALIAMAVYDTAENKRTDYTRRALYSLFNTVDLSRHRVIIIDNNSCKATKELLESKQHVSEFQVITNPANVGTAKAINQAWKLRRTGEHLVKMDNDVVIHNEGWADRLEEAIERDPSIGIIGLKRKDLGENPWRSDWMRSEIKMLPHEAGQPWIIVEKVHHVMGTCQMYNWRLIDQIGGLYQMDGLYGFDDSLAAIRCQKSGFYNCFLPHINIDHIDTGDTPYQRWKEDKAAEMVAAYNKTKAGMIAGTIPINYPL